mmetsp:Transcript_1838/g.6773  ORF Transcript_1838/g.6773 Transcript_1838/m.6773 type:complete len:236 (-) Transcript_1838:162-869(-)
MRIRPERVKHRAPFTANDVDEKCRIVASVIAHVHARHKRMTSGQRFETRVVIRRLTRLGHARPNLSRRAIFKKSPTLTHELNIHQVRRAADTVPGVRARVTFEKSLRAREHPAPIASSRRTRPRSARPFPMLPVRINRANRRIAPLSGTRIVHVHARMDETQRDVEYAREIILAYARARRRKRLGRARRVRRVRPRARTRCARRVERLARADVCGEVFDVVAGDACGERGVDARV